MTINWSTRTMPVGRSRATHSGALVESTSTFREDYVALAATWLVTAYLLLQAIASAITQEDPTMGIGRRLGTILANVAITALFVRLQLRVVRRPPGRADIVTVTLLCVFTMTLLVVGNSWTGIGLALAAVLLTVPLPWNLLVAAALGALEILVLLWATRDPVLRVAVPAVNWLTAVVLYALTRLVRVLHELAAAREHMARIKVDEERHRISRDLHDMIGRTLVAVSLRNEAAMRLIDRDVAACKVQLHEVQGTIISGQTQLRALTSGPVIVGLTVELATARELCARLGIRCETDEVKVADAATDRVLAAVVREAITNMLRHSRPKRCEVSIRREALATVLTIVNDGCPNRDSDGSRGTGLADLASRIDSIGGELIVGPVSGGRFRVLARVPHRTPAASTPAQPDAAGGAAGGAATPDRHLDSTARYATSSGGMP